MEAELLGALEPLRGGPRVGLDGCRAGWVAVCLEQNGMSVKLYATISDAVSAYPEAERILVDIPIGLPHAGKRVRQCDTLARKLLGPRRSSVFGPPCREALAASDHAQANDLNKAVTGRGLSIQAWNIAGKMKEVDTLLQGEDGLMERLLEAHPELTFAAFLGQPASLAKRYAAGRTQRSRILEHLYPGVEVGMQEALDILPSRAVQADDILDACVLALSAGGRLLPLPMPPERDALGLPMAIHVPLTGWTREYLNTGYVESR